ncbi:hypothetical protein BCY91_09555 [Pelobium manganitolerans]|uniref:SdiA-regulated family protein n=1 Tax=Pelobium manganitolerans TaxID=1842495 RepID=A0A419S3E6_9SPHI|nr:SdiA-regulated domain-containing protein [Pelobium manganitolerans]RKD13797.1 hypothetical protein BCY91_09555 [Pelobium manganitolerans]
MKRTSLYTILFALAFITLTAFTYFKRHKENVAQTKTALKIVKTWTLPASLNEVSGIAWAADNLIACVQDEEGKIFLYDIVQHKVVQEIAFADAGDYEGISVVNNDAYVMRSDGLLYQIKNYRSADRQVHSFQTAFNADNNIESLHYDAKQHTFITIPKDDDKEETSKNIYRVKEGQNGKWITTPTFKIDMQASELKEFRGKKVAKTLNLSELAIDPKSEDILVLEGKNPKLLVLSAEGKIKQVYTLDKSLYAQPEGLTFSPDGRMFIANEAGKKDGKANIVEVRLNR